MQHDQPNTTPTGDKKRINSTFLTALMVTGLMLFAEPAWAECAGAAAESPMGNVICQIIAMVFGNLGRGLAILAVIILGVGATIGKVSWGLALTVSVGIAAVFGAVRIAAYLIYNDPSCNMCGSAFGF